MFRLRSFVFTGALALAGALVSAPGASAGSFVQADRIVGTKVLPAAVACNAYSCWNSGPFYNPINRPYYRAYAWPIYRPYRPYAPYYRPYYRPYSSSVTIYRPYESPYYAPRAYSGAGAHVAWCMNRYRTYEPATNRYHAGNGVYRACVSPYP